MKGRTKCPKCDHEFILDIPSNGEKHEVTCPKCEKKFTIKAKLQSKDSQDECFWEEHGEPRKTILSSIKPKTKKPKIAAILLAIIFVLGTSTAIFSEFFIESSMDITSELGFRGTVEIKIINEDNKTINDVTISIEGAENIKKTGNGTFTAKNVWLGIQEIEINSDKYQDVKKQILLIPFSDSKQKIKLTNQEGVKNIPFDSTGCLLIIMIFAIFALLGSIACIKRKHFDLACAGCIIGFLSFGFFFIGSILSIIAFILVYKSKDEFENGKKGKIF